MIPRWIARQAATFQSKPFAALTVFGNLQVDVAAQGGNLHVGPKSGLPGRHGQYQSDVLALEFEKRMRDNLCLEIQVALEALFGARLSLPFQSQFLALSNPLGNLDVDLALAAAVTQPDLSAAARIGLLGGNRETVSKVTAAPLPALAESEIPKAATRLEAALTKDGFEQVLEVGPLELPLVERKGATPAGLTAPAFPANIGAQLVVFRPFPGILEDVIGFPDFLKFLLGIRLVADVRVVLSGQLLIGAPDLLCAGVRFHAHYVVIVLELHAMPVFPASV